MEDDRRWRSPRVSRPSLALGLAIGAVVGALGTYALTEGSGEPGYRSECAADAVRVFISDRGDLSAIIDPECDDDRAGIDYPSRDG